MKKVLSIMLATMMVVSLFAINASAAIPATHEVLEGYSPEIVILTQDFSDAEKTDFTLRNYDGVVSVGEDGVMHMAAREPGSQYMDAHTTTTVNYGEYILEFDFMRTDELKADYSLKAIFSREANASSENKNLQRYGVVIPVRTVGIYEDENGVRWEDAKNPDADIEADTWYSFRITVNESAFVAAGGTEDKAPLLKLFKVERKLASENEWTTLSYHSDNNFPASTYRPYGNNIASDNTINAKAGAEVIFNVNACPNAQGVKATGYVYDETTETYVADTTKSYVEDGTQVDFQFDNIKIYVPEAPGEIVTKDLLINKGITKTSLDEVTKTVVEAKDKEGVVQEGVPATTYGFITLNWDYEPTSFVTTFDAKTNVAGGPLSVSTAGLAADSAMTTIRETEIGKWYSYKIVYSSNGTAVSVAAVYRKAEDEAEWTRLTYTSNKNDAEGYDVWLGYNSSGSDNNLRYYLYAGQTGGNANSNCALGTSWSIRNIQVTDGYAMTGVATVADGNLTIDLNTVVADAAAMIAAVYDGDRLVSAQAVDVAAFANDAEIDVPYSAEIENPAVKIFVLDGMGTMVPMDVPVVITDTIQ